MAKSIKTRKQVLKSEQILANKSLILDYDQPLVSSKDILQTLKNALGSEVEMNGYHKSAVLKTPIKKVNYDTIHKRIQRTGNFIV